jgi:hypothetical protein
VAWLLYAAGRSPFVGQWDSFDYLKQIVEHRPSDLGFGRPFPLAYNIVLWEATRKALGLHPLAVASVAMAASVAAGAIGALLYHRLARRRSEPPLPAAPGGSVEIRHPLWGIAAGLLVPVAVLWQDADVQMHPRYLLVATPPAGGPPRRRGPVRSLGGSGAPRRTGLGPAARPRLRDGAGRVLADPPGPGRSPRLRRDGLPRGAGAGAAGPRRAQLGRGDPVYVCDGPAGWLNLELERLDVFEVTRKHRIELVAPGLRRVY